MATAFTTRLEDLETVIKLDKPFQALALSVGLLEAVEALKDLKAL